jgi:nanoRNase/pAp phosphatase (c-di-AMP/oligoRNAs hydrolase)
MEEKERVTLTDLKDIVILYHAHCPDGFGSAWSAWKKFGDMASYVPVKRGMMLPDGLQDKEVYVVDFSYTKADIEVAESITKKFVMIDHHVSSEEEIRSASLHVFELEHSGAYLTWKYFFPEHEVPLFLEYISDGDMNIFTRENAREYLNVVYARDYTFDNYSELKELFETQSGRDTLLKQSIYLKEYKEKFLSIAEESVHFVLFEGVIMPVNALFPMDERSEVLARIYTKYPPVALMYRYDDGQWKCSLRSNGDFDCTVIATKYGGGGHKGSAGFAMRGDMPLPFARLSNSIYNTSEDKI